VDDLYAHWASIYDSFYPDRSLEISFWARQAGRHGNQFLDLMCGTAEVSLGLARLGFHVMGLDQSPAMLAVARGRAESAAGSWANRLRLVEGRASSVPLPADAFGFALVGGDGSFNHLDDGQAIRALCELARVLRPGGGVGLELVNPQLLAELEEERVVDVLRPTPQGVSVQRRVSNRYQRGTKLFHIRQVTHCELYGEKRVFREEFDLHVRNPNEIHTMLEIAGFRDVKVYGGYGLEAFGRWSADLLVLATTSA
jgi:ubiquinone/menaquinone biosynthesis C-methylase UbiE